MKIRYAVYLFLLLCVFIAGLLTNKKQAVWQQFITVLVGVTFLSETIGFVSAKLYGNNSLVYHVFNPIQYCLFTCIFYKVSTNKSERQLLILALVLEVLFALVNVAYFEHYNQFNSNLLVTNAILIVGWSLYFLYRSLKRDITVNSRLLNIWLMSNGIFFCCTFFIFALLNDWPELTMKFSFLKSLLLIILNALNIIYYAVTGFCSIPFKRKNILKANKML